ncbi:MAG: hypothetical protein RL156_1717 [Bacteroidota bacterium]|jgi:hypothetical protein
MEKQVRTPREQEQRAAFERPTSWRPQSLLPNPNPEPGYTFRWVRVAMLGMDDPKNISTSLGEGWEPVKASEHPEIRLFNAGNNRFPDSIEIGGLLLCKIPAEFMEQRSQYFEQKTESDMRAVDSNFMREGDPRMPLFKNRDSRTTFGQR